MFEPSTRNQNNRLTVLDSLRGIAALSVVLFHFTYGYDNGLKILSPKRFYFTYGDLGVQLFFIISGFVIFMTIEKTKSSKSFFISRFSRLYPAYWSAIMLTISLTTLLSAPFQKGIYDIKEVLVNFSMLQYWFKIQNIDGAYWTLAVELTFYFLIWCLYKFKKLNSIQWFSLIWLSLTFLFYIFEIPFGKFVKAILILNHAPMFASGIGFYLLHQKRGSLLTHILIAIAFICESYMLFLNRSDLSSYIIISLFFILFYLFSYSKLEFLSNKILLFFGSISYTLYLIHDNIGMAIIYWIRQAFDIEIVYVSITFAIVIALAYMVTIFVEQPAMNLIRNYFKNK